VLTDAGKYYEPGEVLKKLKKFNTCDGTGLERVRQAGVAVAIISGEGSAIVHARAAKLKMDDVCCGDGNKRLAIDELCARHGLELDEVPFVGDDLNDLPALDLRRVRLRGGRRGGARQEHRALRREAARRRRRGA
jgi:YrbI family 3-deoxy-D-manno-octulosonate 8-phosphate phosphatase